MDELVAITVADPYMASHGAAHLADDSLFVAMAGDDVAGYIAMAAIDGMAHICEIDVHPSHTGHGLGRLLMAAGEDWARAQGMSALTLTTFIDVPWNGPWYARQGFGIFSQPDWPPGHADIWQGQLASALDCSRRCLMIRQI
jgi:GNAT superfamily N-acetyltransferase